MVDGLRAIRLGDLTFSIVEKYVDDIILVSDEEIEIALKNLLIKDICIIIKSIGDLAVFK